MADGLLGSVLGDEEDKESVEAELEAAVSADAFAVAVAARLSANDPEVARKTAEFLTDQSELLRVQKKHLIEEHELRLSQLRNQKREGGIRRFGMRIRVVFRTDRADSDGTPGPRPAHSGRSGGDREGRTGAHGARYDEALQYAPRWAALEQVREVAGKETH
jgi:hypothetical protein